MSPTQYKNIHPHTAFEELSKMAVNLKCEDSKVDEICRKIHYFMQQALCDLDRRAKTQTLAQNWREFEKLCHGTNLFELGRRDHQIWPMVLGFVGVFDPLYVKLEDMKPPGDERQRAAAGARAYPLPAEYSERPMPSTKPGHIDPVLQDFFKMLREKVSRSKLTAQEKEFVNLGILFLSAESRLPKVERENFEDQRYWKAIWPILDKNGLLDEFRGYATVKRSVAEFLGK